MKPQSLWQPWWDLLVQCRACHAQTSGQNIHIYAYRFCCCCHALTHPGAAEETGRHPNAFNPWGFGIRACIGSQFALWESKVFLAMVLRFFK